jgi:hypothetical protein
VGCRAYGPCCEIRKAGPAAEETEPLTFDPMPWPGAPLLPLDRLADQATALELRAQDQMITRSPFCTQPSSGAVESTQPPHVLLHVHDAVQEKAAGPMGAQPAGPGGQDVFQRAKERVASAKLACSAGPSPRPCTATLRRCQIADRSGCGTIPWDRECARRAGPGCHRSGYRAYVLGVSAAALRRISSSQSQVPTALFAQNERRSESSTYARCQAP